VHETRRWLAQRREMLHRSKRTVRQAVGMRYIARMQKYARWLFAVLMIIAGINHFRVPALYIAMIPPWLPAPAALNLISGAAEIAGGLGLLAPWPQLRRAASWGLIALLLAVFPANIHMAVHQLPLGDKVVPAWTLWARLPVQALLIAWAWWCTVERTPRAPRT